MNNRSNKCLRFHCICTHALLLLLFLTSASGTRCAREPSYWSTFNTYASGDFAIPWEDRPSGGEPLEREDFVCGISYLDSVKEYDNDVCWFSMLAEAAAAEVNIRTQGNSASGHVTNILDDSRYLLSSDCMNIEGYLDDADCQRDLYFLTRFNRGDLQGGYAICDEGPVRCERYPFDSTEWSGCSSRCVGGIAWRINYFYCETSDSTLKHYTAIETKDCNDDVDCCHVGEWGPWSVCSASCASGGGFRKRVRKIDCLNPEGEFHTLDHITQQEQCNRQYSTEWSEWSSCLPGGRKIRFKGRICDSAEASITLQNQTKQCM